MKRTLATATALALSLTGVAAHAAIVNGSFEDDTLGSTAVPTGFARSPDASSVIVDTNVTDGVVAAEVTVDFPAAGFPGGNYFINALDQFEGAPALITGQEYIITADVTVATADSQVTIQVFNGSTALINQSVNTAATPSAQNVTQNLSATFVYGGGGLFSAVQLSDPGFDGGTVTATVDNFQITVVPEPGSLALCGLGGLTLLFRRRG
ncbi:MAG: PEP-CTERM sorting domain-containing protein [Planctomycetota bacterium]